MTGMQGGWGVSVMIASAHIQLASGLSAALGSTRDSRKAAKSLSGRNLKQEQLARLALTQRAVAMRQDIIRLEQDR